MNAVKVSLAGFSLEMGEPGWASVYCELELKLQLDAIGYSPSLR
jgi:hypothetical protein